MIHIKSVLGRIPPLGAAVTLLLASTVPTLVLVGSASAEALTQRSLMVTSTVASDDLDRPDGGTYTVGTNPGELNPGDPRNGQQVGHTYTFTTTSANTIQGFTFEYCDTAFGFVGDGPCAGAPTGFSAASWNGATASVSVNGGTAETWTVTASSANTLVLSNPSSSSITGGNDIVEITFTPSTSNFFVNPTEAYKNDPDTNGTYFAHIGSYATAADALAGIGDDETYIDDGTVTNNVTSAVGIYTRVQETLNFSVEGDAAAQDGGTPNGPTPIGSACDPLTAGSQLRMGDENDALEVGQTHKAISYFRLSTNSAYGTNVFYSGDTLKSSNHTLDPMSQAGEDSVAGTEQFGLGINLDGSSSTSFTTLSAIGPYNEAGNTPTNRLAFDTNSIIDPVPIAQSQAPNGGVSCDTGQVDYVANISPDTPAGIYQTKINYIASPSY